MYGVEHFAIFLYSLVRMQRPKLMIELGTGSGTCSLLVAKGMRENQLGKIISFDSGEHWSALVQRPELLPFRPSEYDSHCIFMRSLAKRYEVDGHVDFVSMRFPPFPTPEQQISILFVDYQSQPSTVVNVLRHFLPLMEAAASIFIDGASTYLPSFLYLERIVDQLNAGKIPRPLLEGLDETQRRTMIDLIHTRNFTLVHLTEAKDRDQNSTAWLKIEPVDCLPYPSTTML